MPHTSDGASFSADLTRGYWSLTLKVSDLELIRNDVEADRVEVEANKNTVASDKAIVSSDKDAVHADRITVEALAGNIPDVSSASPGQILVVNSSKDGYDFGYSSPVGSLLFSVKETASGYLNCDGSAISRTAYSELFAVIGTEHGTGDGSTTFNLPDLRGRFPRAADEGTGRDPYASLRVRGDGTTGGYLGSTLSHVTGLPTQNGFLAALNGAHSHSYSRSNPVNQSVTSGDYGVYQGTEVTYNTAAGGDHTHNITGGDLETAPKSFYVKVLIKYK
jgi:microcystin-dependent protein